MIKMSCIEFLCMDVLQMMLQLLFFRFMISRQQNCQHVEQIQGVRMSIVIIFGSS
ncbi:unnamed protein product [Amoebophrya sp. A25]|nr:unnamed protein product [Amoebophrya sp. A25]|eukprot:GSA25T00013001001.1